MRWAEGDWGSAGRKGRWEIVIDSSMNIRSLDGEIVPPDAEPGGGIGGLGSEGEGRSWTHQEGSLRVFELQHLALKFVNCGSLLSGSLSFGAPVSRYLVGFHLF
jgi:hypothetical protein